MSLPSGTRLGPYELVAPVGAGGMGEVYRARDSRLGRTVAIKVLPPDAADDASARSRFEREARAIAALSHPNICVVHDVGREGSTDYLVMELLDGETLFERLATSKGPLPLDQVLTIGVAIADALDKAHRAGIVHRDLKPMNVMLTKSGPKLLDFGLAKLHTRQSGPVALSDGGAASTIAPGTARGTILGTLHYMAPEQVEGREADARADIWVLGALLYEMATGTRPFDGESAASVLGAILKDTPAPLSARQPLTPPAFEHIVERCLAKDPDERWQSVRDVTRELAWIAKDAAARTPAPDGTLSSPARRGQSKWKAIAIAGLGTTLAMSVVAIRSVRQPQPEATHVERTVLSVVPPDSVRPSGGTSGALALSPNGRRLVFAGLGPDGPPTLWLRTMDDGGVQQLPGTQDASFPFWSPQGDAIGFFAEGKLRTVEIPSGVVKTLAQASSGRGGSWGVDGTILFTQQNSPIMRVSSTGGPVTAVTSLDLTRKQRGHRWPLFVDASRFVFAVQGDAESTGIYLGSLDSFTQAKLAGTLSNTALVGDRLLYRSQGALVSQRLDLNASQLVGDPIGAVRSVAFSSGLGYAAFSVASNDTLAYTVGGELPSSVLRWFDRQGRQLAEFASGTDVAGAEAYGQRLSPDGRTVAVVAFHSANSDLWTVDMSRNTASRFTFGEATGLTPVWSPDGRQLAFTTGRDGVYNLFRKASSGTGAEQRLFKSSTHQFATDWSRDGRVLLFANVDPKTASDIWMTAADGTTPPSPVLATGFNEYGSRLSPDGHWMAFTSDESGRPEVYVQRFPTAAGKIQISKRGGSEPSWRNDGRELYYLSANRVLTFVSATTSTDFSASEPATLFDTIVDTNLGNIHATHYMADAEGRRFLVNVSTTSQTPTTIVLNWQSPETK